MLQVLPGRQARVDFADPQRASTPDRAAVFYGEGDEVVGGGWITRVR